MSCIFDNMVSQELLDAIFRDSAKWGWVEEDPSPFINIIKKTAVL